MVSFGITYGGQLVFTHCYAIGASNETDDNDTNDKQGTGKLLKALNR